MAIGDILREFTVPAPAAGDGRAVSYTETTRQQVITDIINSVALEKAGLSHIINAQGEIIQKVISITGIKSEQLLDIDRSVRDIINSIIKLEIILQSKIQLFKNCLCD